MSPYPDNMPADGILVVAADSDGLGDLMATLRKDPKTRLLPIIVVHPDTTTIEPEPLADLHVAMQPSLLRDALLSMTVCLERVRLLPQTLDLMPSEQQELDLLRFIHTRDLKEIAPTLDGTAVSGFHYPMPEILLALDALSTLKTLDEYAARGLLAGSAWRV